MAFREPVFNVCDFGGPVLNGTYGYATWDAAFQAAITACKASAVGGILFVPAGNYQLTQSLNLAGSTSGSIELVGEGLASRLFFKHLGATQGIIFGSDTVHLRIANLLVRFNDGVIDGPTASPAVTGQHGIYGLSTANAIVTNGMIEDVILDGWGDNGICLIGGTGPIAIRNCQIASCQGVGIYCDSGIGGAPQDVSVFGGSIQQIRGGIYLNAAGRFSCYSTDIELIDSAIYPPVYLNTGANGCLFSSVTVSTNSGPTPAYLVQCEGPANTFVGCMTYARSGVSVTHYGVTNSAAAHNTICGGYAVNESAGTGYLAEIASATHTTFMGVGCAGFDSGKDIVVDTGANKTVVINCGQGDDSRPGVSAPTMRHQQLTYAYLPSNPPLGTTAYITDATVNTWGTATAGGGSYGALVMWDSIVWRVVGI